MPYFYKKKNMKLFAVNSGYFKLDGGAMFGVVPKSIWNKLNPADENNMCNWAMRCLLIDAGDRKILIDNGLGDKQDEKFFSHYYLNGDDTLVKSLRQHGYGFEDITDMVLSHLHFDHCGGSIRWNKDRTSYESAFPNATFWSNAKHWEWATKPNKRERASFLKENILPMQECGKLRFLSEGEELIPGVRMRYANGHTEAMMLPEITVNGKTIVFAADLIPAAAHVPLPYVMAYDMFPMTTLTEKELFLNDVVNGDFTLFLEHDPIHECCTVERTERGFKVKETFALADRF